MITFVLKSNTPREEKTKYALEGLLRTHNLTHLEYRQIITIDDTAKESSTINTKNLNNPQQLLSQYVRVQCNQFIKWRIEDVDKARKMLKYKYPDANQHALDTLISCTLEHNELRRLFDDQTADQIITKKEVDADAYAIVLEDHQKILHILEECNLIR